jgi:hypothetical protein
MLQMHVFQVKNEKMTKNFAKKLTLKAKLEFFNPKDVRYVIKTAPESSAINNLQAIQRYCFKGQKQVRRQRGQIKKI